LINSKLLYWSVVISLAIFLFRFDTVVISGADKLLQQQRHISDLFHGMAVISTTFDKIWNIDK